MSTDADYWLSDEGYIREPDHLPVTEMIFLQTGGLANLTLGPLECYGSSEYHVTLTICWFDVGQTSETSAQHQTNVGSTIKPVRAGI